MIPPKKLIEVALSLDAINKAAARAVIFTQMVDDPSSCPVVSDGQSAIRRNLTQFLTQLIAPAHEEAHDNQHLAWPVETPSPGAKVGFATASISMPPFMREPDFGVTSVNYDFAELLARAEQPEATLIVHPFCFSNSSGKSQEQC